MPVSSAAAATAHAHQNAPQPKIGFPRQSTVVPESWNIGNRGHVLKIINSLPMKVALVVVISLNAIQVIYESDIGAKCKWEHIQDACDQAEGWIRVMNWTYLCLYTIEIGLRIFVHRCACFGNAWDVFDCGIIFVGVMSELFGGVLPSTGALRLFRLAKLARAFQILKLPTELHLMIHGFMSALKAIGLGSILMGMMLLAWTIVAMEMFNDLNQGEHMRAIWEENGCPECVRFFSSVPKAMLTLTQLAIMGEGWQEVLIFIEQYPWSMVIFMGVYFTVVLGMANLVLAVIVDKALQSHDEELQEVARQRAKEKAGAISQFVTLCEMIDDDQSGHLTMDELLDGYDNVSAFKDTLSIMDICKDDLIHVFKIMDRDHSGDVSYNEFAQQLEAIKGQELQTMVSFIKHWVQEIWEGVDLVMGHMMPGSSLGDVMPHVKEVSPQAVKPSSALGSGPSSASLLAGGLDQVPRPILRETLQDVLRETLQGQFSEVQLALERQTVALSRALGPANFFDESEASRADTTDAPMQAAAHRGNAEVVHTIRESEKRLGAQLAELSQKFTSQTGGQSMLVSSSWASCNFPVRNVSPIAPQPLPEMPRLV